MVEGLVFGAPQFLWLLAAPALFLLAWLWRFARRRIDLRRLRERRSIPLRERFSVGGDLFLWLFLIFAIASFAIALARPRGVSTIISRAGVDIVVLQDGSASMHVTDVSAFRGASSVDLPPASVASEANRWTRSMDFLRLLGDSLSWTDDRMALTVFAHVATPQIRLTSDPNSVFFFLDHLHGRPPFRLEEDTTWDTNLEQGIAWGLRLIEKDRELHGPSPNGKLFVLLSDGESWSGEVARAIENAVRARVPLFVIGVGTLAGGALPESKNRDGSIEPSPGISRLERASLQRIAAAGGGQYFELDRDPDREIANAIIDAGRRQAPVSTQQGAVEELYWRFLAGGLGLAAFGTLFIRDRTELWIQLIAIVACAVGLWGTITG
ncbi:MAG TPA: vWA domain-containing protein [Vicinamibacterales bacterium]|nr:vWA domain-containing protein [Vicinamibacterales bacterium]